MSRLGGGVGLAAIRRQKEAASRNAVIAEELAADRAKHIQEQVQVFRKALEEFAEKYRKEINSDPGFRHHFMMMVKSIGVDPLASSKGFWADALGVGSFYFDLAVQVVDVCIRTRPLNGGLLAIPELLARLTRMRGSRAAPVTEDDVRRALKNMGALGSGYSVVTLDKGMRYVQSVPNEMSQDDTAILSTVAAAAAAANGGSSCSVQQYVTVSSLCKSLGWTRERAERALNAMTKEGLAWVDTQASRDETTATSTTTTSGGWVVIAQDGKAASPGVAESEVRYYFPSVTGIGDRAFNNNNNNNSGGGGGGESSGSGRNGSGGSGSSSGAGGSIPSTTRDDEL